MNLTEIDGKIGIWLVLAIVASVVAVIYVLKSKLRLKILRANTKTKNGIRRWKAPISIRMWMFLG